MGLGRRIPPLTLFAITFIVTLTAVGWAIVCLML